MKVVPFPQPLYVGNSSHIQKKKSILNHAKQIDPRKPTYSSCRDA